MPAFAKIVDSEDGLRAKKAQPAERSRLKNQPHIDRHFAAFIAQSPFVVLGTSDAEGRCDVSPKGDAPGFVLVLDAKRLAIPDRVGNNRLDGLLNIIANPHVALIFMIPGREDTLRVNGRAWIIEDDDVLADMVVQGKRPDFAIGVEVEQAFVHCPKAFKRAKLWKTETWPSTTEAPSMARILWDQLPAGSAGAPTCDVFEAEMDARQEKLY